MSESGFLRHVPCSVCGSSDGGSEYTDGHFYCYVCGTYKSADGTTGPRPTASPAFDPLVGEALAITKRGLRDETTRTFNYLTAKHRGQAVQVAQYYDETGRLVGQKVRTKDKDFYVVGDIKEALPFGARAWPKTGKMIVVTEGEIDAMSVSQLQGNKWPVVSIGCGAGGQVRKYFGKHRDYFLGFEKVILMFDMDEVGQKAAKTAAEVLGPTAYIAELPGYKDANEALLAGQGDLVITAMWRAKQYKPEGIVELSSLDQAVKQRPARGLSFPWTSLTRLTYGLRTGELLCLGAGTGTGKSDFITSIVAHLITEHKQSVGMFMLEQAVTETALRIAGKIAGRPFHIPEGWDEAAFDKTWEIVKASGKVFLYDSFGVNDYEAIRAKIEYLCHAEGVKYFFLDHLTALSSGEDERETLDEIMSDLGGLVKRLDATVFFISHLATPVGTPHEEGGRVMIRHLRGSRAIGFWSSFIIAMERNQQAEDEAERHTTTIRILKDRFTGRSTGQMFHLKYNHATGQLFEIDSPEAAVSFGFRPEGGDDF